MNAGSEILSGRQRFLIAGIGGIMPVLLNLIVIDLHNIFLNATLLAVVSYGIRVIALYALGGVVGWLNNDVNDLKKLIQIGIYAPALITAAVNGGHITLPTSAEHNVSSSWNLVSQAYAQSTPLGRFSLPPETPAQQVSRGFLGTTPKNVWYVIAGSYPTVEAAEKQAVEIRQKGFAANVYEPYGENRRYSVVIGANLSNQEAQQLQQKAVSSGLPTDTSLWTFPRK